MHARICTTGLMLIALAGCGGNGQRPPEPIPGSFTTQILADETKMFTFALKGPDDRNRRTSETDRPARGDAQAIASHRLLASLLQQNRYCRDGYVTLQQYALFGSYTIRGECRDPADAQDRLRFPERPPAGERTLASI